MVAACANVADQFKEDCSWVGLAVFVLQLAQFESGWLHYTLFSSRYHDHSLFHSLLLFVYLLGTAVAVVHAKGLKQDDVVGFNVGQAVVRVALAAMQGSVAVAAPRARPMALLDGLFCLIQACIFMAAVAVAADGTAVMCCWFAAILVEMVVWTQASRLLGNLGVPLNIDHMADRSGCFTMVVLGESVVSTAINYSSLASPDRSFAYYAAVVLGFLLTFALALSTFHIQPAREQNAYRRSRCHGISLRFANRLMWVSMLAMGVGIKHVMRAVTGSEEGAASDEEASVVQKLQARFVWLLMISLGVAFFSLFLVRALHYWGRQPSAMDSVWVYRLKMVWWVIVLSWGLLPIACGFALTSGSSSGASDACTPGQCSADPVTVLGSAAGCAAMMVVVETLVVQGLPASQHLPAWEVAMSGAAAHAASPLLKDGPSGSSLNSAV